MEKEPPFRKTQHMQQQQQQQQLLSSSSSSTTAPTTILTLTSTTMAANKDHNVTRTSRSNSGNSNKTKNKNRKQQEAFRAMQQQLGGGVPPAAAAAAPERATSNSSHNSNNNANSMFNTSELLEKHLFASNYSQSSTGGGEADRIVAEMLKSSSGDPSAASWNNSGMAAAGTGPLSDRELLERFPSMGSIDLSGLRGPLSRHASAASSGAAAADLFRSGNDGLLFRSSESNLFHSAAWAPQLRTGYEDVNYSPDLLFRTSSAGEAPPQPPKQPAAASAVQGQPAPVASASVPPPPPRRKTAKRQRSTTADKDYISDAITDVDVLMGRGGRTNHHRGNEDYLRLKEEIQPRYLAATKEDKTAISQELVDRVHARGGRFLKLDQDADRWYRVSDRTARKKASQTLREINTPEVRAAKRARYSKKKKPQGRAVGPANSVPPPLPPVTKQESV